MSSPLTELLETVLTLLSCILFISPQNNDLLVSSAWLVESNL